MGVGSSRGTNLYPTSVLYTKEVNWNTAKQTRSPSVSSDYEAKGLRPGALARWVDRKPFVTKAALLKIEGRMLGKCDGLGCSYSPPGSLSRGNGSPPWTERWKQSEAAEWLTSSGWALGYNKWGLTWPETWETPTKTSKCISFRDSERGKKRERGQERI